MYFTSPPEKREEAVLELLHELKTQSAGTDVVAEPANTEGAAVQEQFFPPPAEAHAELENCGLCGFQNPPDQRFCGMCGVRLKEESSEADIPLQNSSLRVLPADVISEEPRQAIQTKPGEPIVDEFPWREKFSLFHPEKQVRASGWLNDSESASTSYRYYIGAAAAVLIFALGYVAWRGTQRTIEGSLAALPAPTEQTATPTSVPNTSSAQAPTESVTSNNDHVVASTKATEPTRNEVVTNDAIRERKIRERKTIHAMQRTSATDANPQTLSTVGNGAEELAIAQTFLNGTDGHPRSNVQAVGWLWKAVAKHNENATLLLSDLYLKGEGVSQNCDQARILLDAAARKGLKDAADRLRNLQAFGCR